MRKRFLIISISLVVIGFITYFSARNAILNKVLQRFSASAEKSMGIRIEYGHARFSGFKSFYISDLRIYLPSGDTLMNSDSLLINPRLLPLIAGKKRLKELEVYRTSISLNDSSLRLLRRSGKLNAVDTLKVNKRNYAELLDNIQEKLFVYIPSSVEVENSSIAYINDTINASIFCRTFSYKNNKFSGNLSFTDRDKSSLCAVQGMLDKGSHEVTATLAHTDNSLVVIPYINQRWHAFAGFDTLHFSMFFRRSSHKLEIDGQASASHLALQHKRIGPDTVVTDNGNFLYKIHVGDRFLELDSSSVVTVNKFSFSPYVRYENHASSKLTLAFIRKEFEAQSLFESLPKGLFTNFDGLKTQGRLAYHMFLSLDFSNPVNVKFDSDLENKGFKILKYGVTDFRMMNGPFVHEVYENDRLVKTILVSPDNPDFVTVDQVSPYFRYSVLTSEDGDFFYHHGFNMDAFRESIATNLKQKRFARGGSTISMQLVKNVFLSRKKTISRKVEEALIVWIIENLHLSSKQRMFEVYLNIMELGPGVYGIKPASYFYFKKSPADLSLKEAIYLSSIIPRPKGFRFTFDNEGNIRNYFAGYLRLVSGIMIRRNQITPEDTVNLRPDIQLTGEARNFLAKRDTIANEDSLFYIQPKEIFVR